MDRVHRITFEYLQIESQSTGSVNGSVVWLEKNARRTAVVAAQRREFNALWHKIKYLTMFWYFRWVGECCGRLAKRQQIAPPLCLLAGLKG